MQLKRSILFLGQAALLHGLIVFYGFTASPSVEDESANDEMTTYAVDTLTPHAETTETPSSREPSTQTQTATVPPAPLIDPGELDFDSLRTVGDKVIADLANGYTAETTLDPWLNGVAERYLERGRVPYGAAVILDVKSGDILAMADRFDETHPVSQGVEVKGPSSMALMRTAPAASVYKIVTSAALLDKGLNPTKSIHTPTQNEESTQSTSKHQRDQLIKRIWPTRSQTATMDTSLVSPTWSYPGTRCEPRAIDLALIK